MHLLELPVSARSRELRPLAEPSRPRPRVLITGSAGVVATVAGPRPERRSRLDRSRRTAYAGARALERDDHGVVGRPSYGAEGCR